jgi:fibronectin-binding autotransporter adhesin
MKSRRLPSLPVSSKRTLALAISAASLVLAQTPTFATAWLTPNLTGPWATGANWTGGAVPNGAVAEISNGGTAQIVAGDNFSNTEIWDGNGANPGNISQSGGALAATVWFVVGRNTSTGIYDFSGGTITKTGAGHSELGDATGSKGTMTMTNNAAYTATTGEFWVGQGGTGILNIADTASLTLNNWLAIGRTGGTGTINMTGGLITKLTTTGNITFSGAGGNLLQSAGTVTNTASETWISEGGTSQWAMSSNAIGNIGALSVGRSGAGTATLSMAGNATLTATNVTMGASATINSVINLNGGTMTVNNITLGGGTGTRAVNFNGGVLRPTADNAAFLSGFTGTQLNVQAGGAILNTNGKSIGLAAPLSGVGGLTKSGAGILTLSTAQTYGGATVVTDGTLRMGATQGSTSYNLPAGTQAYYAFNGASGANLLKDYSANANNLKISAGTVVGGPSNPAGGGSITLSGSAYLETVSGAFPTGVPLGTSSYTIGAWININNAGNNGIVGWGNYGTSGQVNALRTNTSTGISHYWWAADTVPGTPGSMQSTWTYVAATYDSTTNSRKIYFDGALIGTDAPGIPHAAAATNFRVGVTNGLAEFFNGSMGDLLITNTALTQAQVQAAQAGFATSYIGKTDLLPTNTKLQIGSTGTFDLFAGQQTVGSLADSAGAGGLVVNNGGAGVATLRVGNDGTSTVFSGGVQDGTGATALTKIGAGKLTLTGLANIFSGVTSVEGGTLRIDGTMSTSAVTVRQGTLAGTGAVGGPVVVGDSTGSGDAILSPGDDGFIESLNTGALTLASDSKLKLDLNIVGGASVTSDLVIAGGGLSIASGTALEFVPIGQGNVLNQGTSFAIVDYTGVWNGGLFTNGIGGPLLADDSTFVLGANTFKIDYNAPGDNLTLTVVPEPTAAVSLLGGLGVLLARRRRRA